MTDQLLAEIWAWVKGAAIIYGVVIAVIVALALIFIIKVFRGLMKDF
ncbi:unnamed protein product [marine sediment metagenome]|uniref:Uncharacterized protein n=1 Tax=marine sediment metagenome TaxID=412755 RepID=X1MN83_9ZZZZ